jgi:hypothetical protein
MHGGNTRGPHGPPPQQQSLHGPSPPRSSPIHNNGVKTLVIGGPTPIHLPKPSPTTDSPCSSEDSPEGGRGANSSNAGAPNSPIELPPTRAPNSIFRDRPSDDKNLSSQSQHRSKHPRSRNRSGSGSLDGRPDKKGSKGNDESPQNVLQGLQTPTASFEEKDKGTKADNRNDMKRNDKNCRNYSASVLDVDSPDDSNVLQRKNSTSHQSSPFGRNHQLYEVRDLLARM